MNTKFIAVLCAVLILTGMILAPVLCMPVNSDEYTNSFYVDAFRPVIVTFIVFILAALCICYLIKLIAKEKKITVNPIITGVGIGMFGLFYALMVVYKDAASVLNHFYDSWGVDGDKMALYMPEAADKFNIIAGNYSKLMLVAVAVTIFGAYRVWKVLKNK